MVGLKFECRVNVRQPIMCESWILFIFVCTVEPRYNEVLGTMKITLLYQVSHYIRVKKQRTIKSWDQQNYLVIRGFCYIRPLYNEVPLYSFFRDQPWLSGHQYADISITRLWSRTQCCLFFHSFPLKILHKTKSKLLKFCVVTYFFYFILNFKDSSLFQIQIAIWVTCCV